MTFAEKMQKLIRYRGLDLKDASSAAAIPYDTLRSYTKPGSARMPSARSAVALARSLDVPAEWLFDDTQDWPPPECSAPPFPIRPWPPDGISWEEVRTVLAAHQLRKWLGDLEGIVQAAHKGAEDWRTELQRKAAEMLSSVEELGRMYLQQSEEGKQALDKAAGGPWLRDVAAGLKGRE